MINRIIVTGEMRSGTTFLANFLNSQEKALVYADFLRQIFINGKQLNINSISKILTERELNVISSNLIAEFRMFGFDIQIPRDREYSLFDLFNIGLNKIQEIDAKKSCSVIGIKSTKEYFYLNELLNNDTKIIYIYRDPRDVLLSAKNRFSNYSLFEYADEWTKGIDLAMQFKNHKNFLLVKYEDLIKRNSTLIKSMEDFLNIEIKMDVSKLRLRNGNDYIDNSSFGDVSKVFDTEALDRWKKNNNSDEVMYTYLYLNDYIKLLNYEENTKNYSQNELKLIRKARKKYDYNLFLRNKLKRRIKAVINKLIKR
jgi:hypothetical protein